MSEPDRTPATHDMGGAQRFRCTPVERDEEPPDEFGRRVDALRQILAAKKLMTVDELRRGIESSQRLGRHRWKVERTFSWLLSFRKLAVRRERSAATFLALGQLGCALIVWRHLQRLMALRAA